MSSYRILYERYAWTDNPQDPDAIFDRTATWCPVRLPGTYKFRTDPTLSCPLCYSRSYEYLITPPRAEKYQMTRQSIWHKQQYENVIKGDVTKTFVNNYNEVRFEFKESSGTLVEQNNSSKYLQEKLMFDELHAKRKWCSISIEDK